MLKRGADAPLFGSFPVLWGVFGCIMVDSPYKEFGSVYVFCLNVKSLYI